MWRVERERARCWGGYPSCAKSIVIGVHFFLETGEKGKKGRRGEIKLPDCAGRGEGKSFATLRRKRKREKKRREFEEHYQQGRASSVDLDLVRGESGEKRVEIGRKHQEVG